MCRTAKILNLLILLLVTLPACAKDNVSNLASIEASSADTLPSNNVFRRYVGILHHDDLKRDQLAKIDFILSRETGNKLELMAVLTLHFGDFKSKEYVAYHFDNVQYNLITQTLVFDQPEADVSVKITSFGSGKLEGELRSNFSGNVGKLVLSQDTSAAPQYPLIEPISGEYEGKCLSYPSRLQLLTYRSTDDTARIGNPFATYRVRGELGQNQGEKFCGLFGPKGYCIAAYFEQGSYNFFKKHLVLNGPKQNLVCTVDQGTLTCGQDCQFRRVSDEMTGPLTLSPPVSQSLLSNPPPNNPAIKVPVESIQGEYSGYVHHEYLNTYQAAKINIMTYQGNGSSPEAPKLQLSAIASLFFGGFQSAEAISYRFATRPYPNPLTETQFVFRRSENDVDAILQVTEFGDGVVKGVWNSILFGRVGSFELRKDGQATLPPQAKKMGPISGMFEGNQWDLNLVIGLGKTPPNTENPFFPLSFAGWALFREAGTPATITSGSYDFYTGKLGFENGEKSVFIGTREETKGMLRLKKFGRAITSPQVRFEAEAFRRVPFN